MPKTKRVYKHGGTTRMKELGKRPLQIWLTPDLRALIEQEAKAAFMPMATFVLASAIRQAREAESIRRHLSRS